MKTAMILAGGKGTRFSEMTDMLPKPMITAGKKPILIHIINFYITYNVKNIIVLAGYKKDIISNYFSEILIQSSEEKDLYQLDDISIKVLDTGLETMTGGRLKRGIEYLNSEEDFFLTYGDALSDVNLKSLEEFHSKNKPIVSITAVRPPARFGSLELKNNVVEKFGEKDQTKEGWINGGFFIINNSIKNYISDDTTILEKSPLEKISLEGKLMAYKHNGFWQCADTIRELELLEKAISEIKYEEKFKGL